MNGKTGRDGIVLVLSAGILRLHHSTNFQDENQTNELF